jgi:hypothetical protein
MISAFSRGNLKSGICHLESAFTRQHPPPKKSLAPVVVLVPEMPQRNPKRFLTEAMGMVALLPGMVFHKDRKGAGIVELAQSPDRVVPVAQIAGFAFHHSNQGFHALARKLRLRCAAEAFYSRTDYQFCHGNEGEQGNKKENSNFDHQCLRSDGCRLSVIVSRI